MTLLKHLRYSVIASAVLGAAAALFILWGAIQDNPQQEFYDTGTGEIFFGYILACFGSIFVSFMIASMAVYWGPLLGWRGLNALIDWTCRSKD